MGPRRSPISRIPEALTVSAIAGVLALAVVLLGPPDDASAHLYRTFLVHQNAVVWDNLWYAGAYPLASYSPLYYFPAAVVGNTELVVVCVALSAGLFASIARVEWGDAAVWPGRVFAVFALGPVVTGTYAYALGLLGLLATLRLLQRRRLLLALVGAALTLGASPLAFVFLCLVLVALVAARPRITRAVVVVACAVGALTALEAAVLHVFQLPGAYPFLVWNLIGVAAVSILGVLIALRVRENGRLLVTLFAVWGGACLVGFLLRSPLGDNLDRLRYVAFPLLLVGAARLRFRPRFLVLGGMVTAFGYAAVPDVASVLASTPGQAVSEAYWQPATRFLRAHASTRYRVEVVPTSGRWEAYWLPRSGVALARGWYRQLDLATNHLLYRRRLDPIAYRAWLRDLAIGYVVLAGTQLDPQGSRAEAQLLRSGRSGLTRVFRDDGLVIYAVDHPVPLISGRAPAHLTAFGHDRIAGIIEAPGDYTLRVRYMPYWSREAGSVCLTRTTGGMTTIHARRAGAFALTVPDEPIPLVSSLLDGEASASCS